MSDAEFNAYVKSQLGEKNSLTEIDEMIR